MNCTGKRCIMQFDKVDPATCQCVSYCPQATPPKTKADLIRTMSDEELNNFIDGVMFKSDERNRNIRGTLIRGEFLTWLKQEAEESE